MPIPGPGDDPYRDAVEIPADERDPGDDRFEYIATDSQLICPWCGVQILGDGGMPAGIPLVDAAGLHADYPDANGETRHYHPKCYRLKEAERHAAENRSLAEFEK